MTDVVVIYGVKEGPLIEVVKVPFAKRADLQRTGIVAMAIVDPDNPIRSNRHQNSISHDIYHLIWTDTDCHLGGHDEDFLFCPLTESWKNPVWRFPYILPKNCIEFEGVYVSKEAWQEALKIYADPDGLMF